MRESDIQSRITKQLESVGWLVVKIIQCNKNGWPDLMALRDNQTVFIEVKAPGKKPRPLQQYRHQQLIKQGFKTIVIDNPHDPELTNLCH